jgi:cell division GTPase FtsZ
MNIAIIGLGGAGGNIAEEAAKAGFLTGAINYSQKDLDTLEHVPHKLKMLGSEGVGHDRAIAFNLFAKHYELVTTFLSEHFSNPSIECIIFASSTSGGSGSGIITAIIDIASSIFPDKVFCAVAILPDLNEVTNMQINCSQTLEDLSQLDIAVFPIDNHQVKLNNPNVGKNVIFETTNQTFVSLLSKIISYTDKHSKNGNFDKRDMLTVLSTKGLAMMAECDIASLNSNLSSKGIANAVHASWDASIFTPVEYVRVVRAGVIFDAQESLMKHLDQRLIFEKFKDGMPIDLFEGNYHESNGKIFTIMSGLPLCKVRLSQIDELIESSLSKVENARYAEQEVYQSKAKAVEVSSILKSPKQEDKPKRSVNDIFSKWKR